MRTRIRLFPALAAVFIGMTLLDSLTLYLLGRYTGFWLTVLSILISGLLGAWMVKGQVRRVWQAIQQDLNSGRMPAESVLDGAIILVAGAFLAAPGFLTDILGILLLLPPVRVPIKRVAQRKIEEWAFRQFRQGVSLRAEPPDEWK